MEPFTQDEVDGFKSDMNDMVSRSLLMVAFIFLVQAVIVLGLFGAGVWVLLTLLRMFGVL
jgi:hypothetical protein